MFAERLRLGDGRQQLRSRDAVDAAAADAAPVAAAPLAIAAVVVAASGAVQPEAGGEDGGRVRRGGGGGNIAGVDSASYLTSSWCFD